MRLRSANLQLKIPLPIKSGLATNSYRYKVGTYKWHIIYKKLISYIVWQTDRVISIVRYWVMPDLMTAMPLLSVIHKIILYQ